VKTRLHGAESAAIGVSFMKNKERMATQITLLHCALSANHHFSQAPEFVDVESAPSQTLPVDLDRQFESRCRSRF
jgi:hypothetical protein